jgi:hypothetical protein
MNEDGAWILGGCLCGGVRYRYTGALGGAHGLVTQCHCGQCRKAQGGPASVAPASAEALVFTAGKALITEYESSPGKFRGFCGRCGSPLYSRRAERPNAIRLRLGAMDDPPQSLHIEAHIHDDDRASWEDSASGAPRYPAQEPDR